MSGWRARLLDRLPAADRALVLVNDPDKLLADEDVQQALDARGYAILPFEDPVAFRLRYEAVWQSPEVERRSLVAVRSSGDVAELPWDLVRAGRQVSVGLGDLYPTLDPVVLRLVPSALLDRIEAGPLPRRREGRDDTRALVLRRVYGLDPDVLDKPETLLTALFRLHQSVAPLPRELAADLAPQVLAQAAVAWPLAELLAERSAFVRWVSDHWRAYVRRRLVPDAPLAAEPAMDWGEELPDLPFHDLDVRSLLDTWFLDGILPLVDVPADLRPIAGFKWMVVGLRRDPKADAAGRLRKLLDRVEIPGTEAGEAAWRQVAWQLSELSILRWRCGLGADDPDEGRYRQLRVDADDALIAWALQGYGRLASLPHHPAPVMLHHVPRFMADRLEHGKRLALLVMDGLALDQWIALRDAMPSLGRVEHDERATFAWVPTLTSVSRQTIFRGEPPYTFPTSIKTTSREESWWKQFWEGRGERSVGYLANKKLLSDERLDELVGPHGPRVLGLVWNLVDDFIHHWDMDRQAAFGVVTEGAAAPLGKLLNRLLDSGFEVFLTADHGNEYATGVGSPGEGVLPEIRAERARAYATVALRDDALSRVPEAIAWPGPGLPPDLHVLLAPRGRSFGADRKRGITHGGISVAELFVPFVHIRRTA